VTHRATVEPGSRLSKIEPTFEAGSGRIMAANRFTENLGGGVEHQAVSMPSGVSTPGETWKDVTAVGRQKNLLPRVAPGPVQARPASRLSSRRLRRERWLANRLARLADRMERRRERLAVRWDKIARQRRREGLAFRVRHRWYLLTERVEPLIELLMIRWYRFVFHVAARWERVVLAVGLSAALAVTVITLLPLGAAAPDLTDGSDARSPSPVPSTGVSSEPGTPSPVPSSSGLSMYTNGVSGYVFSYPNDWDVSTSGTVAVLSDPEGQIEISFHGAPPGPLQEASDGVLEELSNSYGSPETIATEVNRHSSRGPRCAPQDRRLIPDHSLEALPDQEGHPTYDFRVRSE
jgi:hypothetical protein